MKLTARRVSKLEIKNADALKALAEEEHKKKEAETREARNREAETRLWAMFCHYYEDPSGQCSEEAAIMLERVLQNVNDIGEPDIEKISLEERAFYYMLYEVFEVIDPEWLIDNEIDYQLDKLLGKDAAQEFRSEATMDERIILLDNRLGPSWRAVQFEYPACEQLNIEPEKIERFLRGREAIKEVAEGTWTGKVKV
jgi:hypothetical protein